MKLKREIQIILVKNNNFIIKRLKGGKSVTIDILSDEIQSKEIIDEVLSREIVFEKLFNSYNYGNLGLFVGAGFSKAAMEDQRKSALNWLELIKATSERLEIEFPSNDKLVGVSLPELATSLCKDLSEMNNISYKEAKGIFKNEICKISDWLPSEEQTKRFRAIFDKINPAWIITTNYDLVLETILIGIS